MRNTAIGMVSLAALTLTGCGGPRGPNGLDRGETLLQVAASGQSETRPDEANISVGVSSIGATSEAATAAKTNFFMTALLKGTPSLALIPK